jgi:pimeloyl-ACP methyl ester carboxylesterase
MLHRVSRRRLVVSGILGGSFARCPGAGAATPTDRVVNPPATFVLVHGAWHGGWCWSRVVGLLQERGHAVFAPSLTGLGDRAHLFGITPEIRLATHVTDIVNLVKSWELDEIVLCGHSYGGMVITGVAEQIADRIGSIVYVDAMMPENGQSALDIVGAPPPSVDLHADHPAVPNAAAYATSTADQHWIQGKLTPLPAAVASDKLQVTGAYQRIARKTAIRSTGIDGKQPDSGPGAKRFPELARRGDWELRDIACKHDIMIDRPAELAAILLASLPRH